MPRTLFTKLPKFGKHWVRRKIEECDILSDERFDIKLFKKINLFQTVNLSSLDFGETAHLIIN